MSGWWRSVAEEPTGMGKGEVAVQAKPTLGMKKVSSGDGRRFDGAR